MDAPGAVIVEWEGQVTDAPRAVFVKKKDRCLREQLALCALFRYNKLGLRLLGAMRLPEQEQSQEQEQQHRVSPRQHLAQWVMVCTARSAMPALYGAPAAIKLREVQDAVQVWQFNRPAKAASPRAF